MSIKNLWNRRTFLGGAGTFAGVLLNARRAFGLSTSSATPAERLTGFGSSGNAYEELGLTTVINGQGTMTYLGGANAMLNNSPHEDTIGRASKVGKEEIVGMVKALECYLNDDHAALDKEWWRRLDYVSAEISRIPGVTTSFNVPDIANHVPHMGIFWDPRKISLTPRDASKALRAGTPSIVLGSSDRGLGMNSFMLKPGEEKIIAQHLAQLFKAHSA